MDAANRASSEMKLILSLDSRLNDDWVRQLVVMQDALTFCAHTFFRNNGLKYLNLPLTTGSISSPMGLGSDSKPLKIKMEGVEIYLADSMQFLLEYGCRFVDVGCFYLMPSFRAEDVDCSHLQQFFHLEAEIRGSFEDTKRMVEGFLIEFSGHLLNSIELSKRTLNRKALEGIARQSSFDVVTYSDAAKYLADKAGATEAVEGLRLRRITRCGEQYLIDWAGPAVWLVDPPAQLVPFYQASDALGRTRCGDLLLGKGEICGAGERWTNGQLVRKALQDQHLSVDEYEWYVEMKDLSPSQTSGFGIGVERLLAWAAGIEDIRKCEFLPRRNDRILYP